MQIGSAASLFKKTYSNWSDHNAPRLGASVAFYTLLSFAPLLVLTVAVAALVFDQQRAQAGLVDQARQMIGDRGADTVKSLLVNAHKPSSGVMASIIAFLTLLFGASGVFTELRNALNIIWDAQPTNESGFMGMVKQRLFSFGMVLSVGFLLLVSLIISAILAVLGKFFGYLLPLPAFVFEILNFAVSFLVIAVLFALLFKFVPARKISWRDVWVGAIGTAILFTLGKFLLGFYLGKASVGSAYGAAGSLVAVIVWVYYSAQIFFFGAEFTRVHADAHVGTGARDHDSKAAASQDAPGRRPYGAAANSQSSPASGHRRSSVENEPELQPGQVKSLPAPEHKSAAVPAVGRAEASVPAIPKKWTYTTSVTHKSRASLVLAAVWGFLIAGAVATKRRHPAPDTRSRAGP
jgi:membrane protein